MFGIAKAFVKSTPPIPQAASLLCRAGNAAWKGQHPESAIANFIDALKLCPHLWEAFEGLCALGMSFAR
jgi:anaphase-promoting complex subunit 3